MVRLMATSYKRAYARPRCAAPRASAPTVATADLYLHRRHSNTQTKVWLSLCGVLVHTRFCLRPLSISGSEVWGLNINVI